MGDLARRRYLTSQVIMGLRRRVTKLALISPVHFNLSASIQSSYRIQVPPTEPTTHAAGQLVGRRH
jgi:hypothetical protein